MDGFADAALQLCAMSARLLGWTPDTFWNATPDELAACLGLEESGTAPPTRAEIAALMERDENGR